MRNSHIEVKPISGALGAEIEGVDVAADLDDTVVVEIRQALLDYGVIFFRDQKLDVVRHKAFTRRFGEIFIHPNYKGVSVDPEIVDIRREPGDKRIVGEDWHTDTTMVAEPPLGAVLYAIEVPPYGGDTLFANQYLAYESLSDGLKRTLESMRAVHSDRMVAGPQAGMNAHRSTKVREDADWRETISHPSRGADPSGNRPKAAVHQPVLYRRLRGLDGSGEQAAAGLSAGAGAPARVYLPLSMGERIDRFLGQPLHQTPGHP